MQAHVAPGYDPQAHRQHHLALFVSQEQVGAAVLDQEDGALQAFWSGVPSQEDPIGGLKTWSGLPTAPARVSAVCLPDQSVLVPASIDSAAQGQAHMTLLHGATLDGNLRDRPLEEAGARFYFIAGQAPEQGVLKHWPAAKILPMQLSLTRSALHRAADREVLLVHVSGQRADIVIVHHGKLRLCNSFHVVNAEDVLYYVLFTLDRTGTDRSKVHLYMAGPGMHDATSVLLGTYIEHAAPTIAPGDVGLGGISLAHPHYWSDLIERPLCVS